MSQLKCATPIWIRALSFRLDSPRARAVSFKVPGGLIQMLPAALTAKVLLRRAPIRIPFLAIVVISSFQSWVEAYQAQRPQVSDVPQLTVIVSKSIIVNTAEPIERVAVTSTEIADALVISPQQIMI